MKPIELAGESLTIECKRCHEPVIFYLHQQELHHTGCNAPLLEITDDEGNKFKAMMAGHESH